MSFQAPSLQTRAEPPSACVSTITSINNNSCGGGNNASAMSSMAPPPPAKPALQEPQLPKSNKSELISYFHLHRFIRCCISKLAALFLRSSTRARTNNTQLDPLDETLEVL